ncbi:C4-dicarboxylate transporter DctA [Gammaproteobacteria bacterium]|nr:C4-dicarboxylate transporter DctA [Gammaproteobacteria bacterium]
MKLFKSIFFWIIFAFIAGCILGLYNPRIAIEMEPFGSSFIKLIKVFIAPIIFLTVSTGIAQTGSLKKLGSIGLKTIIYFEVVSTIALAFGWIAVTVIKPGKLINANLNNLDSQSIAYYISSSEKLSFIQYLQNLIPSSIIEPFSSGNLLQVLLVAILFGIALLAIGENKSKNLLNQIEKITQCFFQIIKLIMYAAPIGIFGAMAYTVGKFGSHLLLPLMELITTFYITGILFIIIILGSIAKISGFSIYKFLKFMLPELILVLGTSSSEAALPHLIKKLEKLGCERETVGIVVPMGYSFNLDGTNIYIAIAAIFIAQALGIELTFSDQLLLFITAMLSSKGAAGVTGSGFITLAATLSVVSNIPVVGIVLILGIDRFMSTARSLINYIGNGTASIVISRWQNEISAEKLNKNMCN